MAEILRPDGAQQHDPRIDAWLEGYAGDVGVIARELVRLVRFHAVGGTEVLLDGRSVTCIDGGAYVYVAVAADHVRLGFYQGEVLPDPAGLLEAGEGAERFVRLVPRGGIQAGPVIALIEAAYDDMALRASGTQ